MIRFWIACSALTICSMAAVSQTAVPSNQFSPVKDASSLKPPAGAKVAIIEYEDLECPYCAKAFPIVHAAANHYKIQLLECDYQISYHAWSHDAAICAHYLKAKVSADLSEEYRREVFALQSRISSRDDLHSFTQAFFSRHGQQIPFVMDPTGQYAREISETTAQGDRIGIPATPSIFVVTNSHWIEVKDVDELYQAIDQAEAETAHSAAPRKKARPGA